MATMWGAILSVGIMASALPARAQSTATLRGVDVYRSAFLSSEAARARFGARLGEYVMLKNRRLPALDEKAAVLLRGIEREVAGMKGVLLAEVHATEYFTSVDHAIYVLFDVVDKVDAARLEFAPAPKARFADPDDLLAAWRRYVDAGEVLSRRGEIAFERPACPGFYCLWGGKPELDEAQKQFVAGVSKRGEDLRRVLRADADGGRRADALFVLSYSASGRDVVGLCREALSDPDARARGAALQILADIANHRSDLAIPIEAVLPRLDDPSAAVRGKAMGLLVPLAGRTAYRTAMLAAAPRLAVLLRLSHPESRDLAFTVLGILSNKNYDRRDFDSWSAWAAQAAAGKP